MKTLVLGDIHGRTCWKEIFEKENPDRVIFLGDYFSSHEDISEEDQIKNYNDILDFKHNTDKEVIMLRGNHDLEALKYYWAECWPAFYNNFLHNEENRKEFLDNTQWIYKDGDIIFSHAGISENWFLTLGVASIEDINTLLPSEKFGFKTGPDNPYDSYGNSIYQSCVWIRPSALCESAIPGTHVIGHTRIFDKVTHLSDHMKEEHKNDDIWLCDALPQSYLTIEDGEFNVHNLI